MLQVYMKYTSNSFGSILLVRVISMNNVGICNVMLGKVFPMLLTSFGYPKEFFTFNFKIARKKRSFNEVTSNQFLLF